ncbi:TorF family putative porin [Pseudomonas aeruginosa]|uniref:TorF family putative porin n=1 Tax=Pseudomonas aeruginosa TaxID=287 RepID=UPI0038916239
MLKKLTLATAAASAVTASSFAVAETLSSPVGDFDVSMNVGLTSDYIFRGISQTQGNGAIQGLYAGIPEISVSPAPVPPRAHPGR